MEHVIPDKIKTYFYEMLIKEEFERFLKFNSLETKSFGPIIINSQNSYLSNYILINYSLYYIQKTRILNQTMNSN